MAFGGICGVGVAFVVWQCFNVWHFKVWYCGILWHLWCGIVLKCDILKCGIVALKCGNLCEGYGMCDILNDLDNEKIHEHQIA